MSRFDPLFADALRRRDAEGLRRRAVPIPAPDGTPPLNFSSNDYLGLARHPALARRAGEFAARFGTGAASSRLICGTLEAHEAVEARIAALKGREAAMLLATGWQANASVLATLLRAAGPGATLFADELNHNSLVMGARLAGVRPVLFRHNDLQDLECKLQAQSKGRKVIGTESVFSMDGDRADIAALARLADRYDAFLYVDEAHATGVLGPGGAGLTHGIAGVDLVMGTCSKALGSFGAYVAGSRTMVDFLQNMCAGFIYTTAPPPPVLGAIDAALDLLPALDSDRHALASRAALVRAAFADLGIDTGASATHIVPALVGDTRAAVALADHLRARDILAVAIRPPTVPPGTARLRFALTAAHDDAAIATLLASVRACWPARRDAA